MYTAKRAADRLNERDTLLQAFRAPQQQRWRCLVRLTPGSKLILA